MKAARQLQLRKSDHNWFGAYVLPSVLVACLVGTSWLNLQGAPPLWWDEGWTMTVARTWVQSGHYGRLLSGQPAPAGLSGAFPIVAPVALSFRLFGVGIWQARLPFVLMTLAAFALVYYLAGRLYNRFVAVGALAVLLLTSTNSWLNPILMGRQVLGEVPALLFLLIGYAFLLPAIKGRKASLLLVALFWGVALITKAQVLPFWAVSVVGPAVLAAFERRKRIAAVLLAAGISSLVVSRLLLLGIEFALAGRTIASTPIPGLYQITALVLVPWVRYLAVLGTFFYGLPSVLGLLRAISVLGGQVMRKQATCDAPAVVRVALLSLSASWLAWYLLLSNAWPRYLFPVTFVGSIFISALLHDLFDRPRPSLVARRAVAARLTGTLLVLGVLLVAAMINSRVVFDAYVREPDTSVIDTARYLNTETPTGSLVETYESELFPFLNRPYHFPPDAITVPMTLRTTMKQDVPLEYDALEADPDYLVVKPSHQFWAVYERAITNGEFRVIRTIGRYVIYERAR